jgi:hypothetical protein
MTGGITGRRVRSSWVFVTLAVFVLALTAGLVAVALAEPAMPDPAQDSALATTLEQSVSGNVATPTIVKELTAQDTATSASYLLSNGPWENGLSIVQRQAQRQLLNGEIFSTRKEAQIGLDPLTLTP